MFKIMQTSCRESGEVMQKHAKSSKNRAQEGVENQPCFHLKLAMLGMSRANLARRGACSALRLLSARRKTACPATYTAPSSATCAVASPATYRVASSATCTVASSATYTAARHLHNGIVRRLHSGPPLTQWLPPRRLSVAPPPRRTTNARPPNSSSLFSPVRP